MKRLVAEGEDRVKGAKVWAHETLDRMSDLWELVEALS